MRSWRYKRISTPREKSPQGSRQSRTPPVPLDGANRAACCRNISRLLPTRKRASHFANFKRASVKHRLKDRLPQGKECNTFTEKISLAMRGLRTGVTVGASHDHESAPAPLKQGLHVASCHGESEIRCEYGPKRSFAFQEIPIMGWHIRCLQRGKRKAACGEGESTCIGGVEHRLAVPAHHLAPCGYILFTRKQMLWKG